MFKSLIGVIPWMIIQAGPGIVLAQGPHLSVHINVGESIIVLGEPLIISAHVKNVGSNTVNIYNQNSPTYNRGPRSPFLLIVSDTGVKWDSWNDGFRPRRKTEPIELRPGQEIGVDLTILFCRSRGFAFAEPGSYWVSVKVICTDGSQVQAEPIKINVIPPTDDGLKAWHTVNKIDLKESYGELVQAPWQAALDATELKGCDKLISDFQSSPYSTYLSLSLGRWYLEGPNPDAAKSRHYLEIAKSRASSEPLKTRILNEIAKIPLENPLERLLPGKDVAETPEHPVEPEVQKQVEAAFHGYLAAGRSGDLERMLSFTADDYGGMSRDQQRKRFQDEIDEVKDLQRRGIPSNLSAKVISVVGTTDDVLLTATVVYEQGSTRRSENTVHCRLRKYGEQWLLQDWDRISRK